MDNSKPNIILIITDQQSASMMSCAGNRYVNTPNMDRIAARGIRFERAYATNPVCVPARVSLLSGQMPNYYNGRYNEDNWQVSEDEQYKTLGQLISNAGYETVYGGKEHVPQGLQPHGAESGYNYFCPDERDVLAGECADFIRQPHDRPFFLVASFINPHDICYMAIRDQGDPAYSRRMCERGVKEVAALDEALKLPEGISEAEFFEKLCPPLPPNHLPQADEPEAVNDMITLRDFKINARNNWTDKEWRMHRWAYKRLTEKVDAEIGVVLDALEEAGLADDALIIFTSDHGDNDSAHKLEHKTVFYEEAACVPFIVSAPGNLRAGEVDATSLVSNGLDILPTVCDYAGATVPADKPGLSLKYLIEGRNDDLRDILYMESEFGDAAVCGHYKYAVYNQGRGANNIQLYDLKSDPFETRNCLYDPGNAEIAAKLKKELAAYVSRKKSYSY